MLTREDRIFIGKNVYEVVDAISQSNGAYKDAQQVLSYSDLSGMRDEISMYTGWLMHFAEFRRAFGITEADVEAMIEEYKRLNMVEYFDVKGKETLTTAMLFGPTYR